MGLASGTGAVAHPSRGFYSRAAGAQRPWSGRPGCRRGSERPAMGAPVTPETCDGRPSRGRFVLCLKTPGSPHRWDDRSPGAVWSPAPMESVDRWPLASPDTQIPGGSRPAGAAVRRRVRGVWTPHPRPVCRRPHSARKGGLVEHPACGPVPEGLQWGQLDGHVFRVPPVRRGSVAVAGRSFAPSSIYLVTSWPLRGFWAAGDWFPPFRWGQPRGS